jgi:hypothetical protein
LALSTKLAATAIVYKYNASQHQLATVTEFIATVKPAHRLQVSNLVGTLGG